MKEFILQRLPETEYGTPGVIFDGALKLCHTIERGWLNNEANISDIPGDQSYVCIVHDSEKHPISWEVTGVKDRSGVLIHEGNTEKDSLGCIIVGLESCPEGVLHSRDCLHFLKGYFPDEPFMLKILNA